MLTLLSLFALPFVQLQPNRIMPGEGYYLIEVTPMPVYLIFLALALLMILCSSITRIATPQLAICFITALFLLINSGSSANELLSDSTPFARVSLGSAFWTSLFLIGLLITDAIIKLGISGLKRLLFVTLTVSIVLAALSLGSWTTYHLSRSTKTKLLSGNKLFATSSYLSVA